MGILKEVLGLFLNLANSFCLNTKGILRNISKYLAKSDGNKSLELLGYTWSVL